MSDAKDWRVAVQHEYLRGVQLLHRAYRQYPENPDWDHDHCAFCWMKFELPRSDQQAQTGYCTLDEYHWICEECFRDFKARFGWTVAEPGDAA